jgi:hypothetical protein
MKDDERIKDARSTGRKRGRAILVQLTKAGERNWKCAECGLVPKRSFEESIQNPDRREGLDCNHKNKNILDNDPANLEWLCRICHYEKDRATTKGVSTVGEDEYGYGI